MERVTNVSFWKEYGKYKNQIIQLLPIYKQKKQLDMVQYEINVLMFIVMEHLKRCVSHNASGSDVKDCILHWIFLEDKAQCRCRCTRMLNICNMHDDTYFKEQTLHSDTCRISQMSNSRRHVMDS